MTRVDPGNAGLDKAIAQLHDSAGLPLPSPFQVVRGFTAALNEAVDNNVLSYDDAKFIVGRAGELTADAESMDKDEEDRTDD